MTDRHADDGVSTVELAVLMPVLLFWLMLIVQFGLWYHAKQVVTAAANEAVDAARLPTGTEEAGDAGAALVLNTAGNLTGTSVVVSRTAAEVTAKVEGHAPQLVPGFAWTVAAEATAPVERFIAANER